MTCARDPHPGDDATESVKTISLTDRDLEAAARLLNAIVGVGIDRGRELTTLAKLNTEITLNDRSVLVKRAHRTYVNRARRSQLFNPTIFGEAAWDMLLALYVTDQSGPRQTVSGLTSLSGVPPTTALRWLNFLEKEELAFRSPNPFDGRVSRVELTAKGRELLDMYFSAIASED